MRVIPVLDLKDARAVHARGGTRRQYEPVHSRLAAPPGDAVALARAYGDVLSLDHLYVADLDAILGGEPQRSLVRSIAALGSRLLLDAGITTPAAARQAIEDGATAAVIGLETLPSFAVLSSIAGAVGSERVIFSLDLRDGEPVGRSGGPHLEPPLTIVRRAIDAGASSVIVLDLGRVGTGRGADLPLVGDIRRAFPGVELMAGGGVRGLGDLEQLADAGCDGALIASALHHGHLGPSELAALQHRPPLH